MILIGGQRSRTACASLSPSIEPGMWISVNTTRISRRLSRIAMASSALAASITAKPASSTVWTAQKRTRGSSSTIRTAVAVGEPAIAASDELEDLHRGTITNVPGKEDVPRNKADGIEPFAMSSGMVRTRAGLTECVNAGGQHHAGNGDAIPPAAWLSALACRTYP